ncbi:S1 family peptidase [Actinokineospora sp. UTMC 2448]|uniref:S1 family peptidase n=1 Tax=Actinokineospora sp. UTMC 2448 TaxID=2268449 RepID=UPI002164E1FE|nr:S1 family peptidase [Actinokineospora sp. UTMC 2448]UVS80230.1 Alpha-lytic protease precursor [Actinokineospora sp. UTMC 2448]
MKRTLVAVALLTVAGASVAALPALAAAPADPAAAASPGMLAAMERDLGLSKDAALARIAAEDKAARTEDRLRATLSDAFGGSWFDAASGTLVVGVTDAGKASAVRADGARAAVVRHSARKLDATADTLDRSLAAAPAGVTGWYVDVQRNTVTVTAAPGATAQAKSFVARAGADRAAVTVVESAETPRTLYNLYGGDAYYMGSGGRCSVGFSVQGGYVTAGHCGRVGTSTTGSNRVAQGTFRGSSFPGDDLAVVAVNSSWTPQGMVNRYDGYGVSVRGSQEAPVGSSVCRSGSTTGWHCGTIQSKNQTVRYAEGAVYGLTRTSVCAEPGDSGGSFISGNQAQGVTSGGSGDCTSGGTTYFQPVNEILNRYGLTLVTR